MAWAAVVTDRSWVCPTLAANHLLARHVPVFAYEFADARAPLFFPAPDFEMGAYHGSELSYLFDILDWSPEFSAE
jgi:para-nitrobenzyl esterase